MSFAVQVFLTGQITIITLVEILAGPNCFRTDLYTVMACLNVCVLPTLNEVIQNSASSQVLSYFHFIVRNVYLEVQMLIKSTHLQWIAQGEYVKQVVLFCAWKSPGIE
jgi:hypothetical protein